MSKQATYPVVIFPLLCMCVLPSC